jgi:hypothetical protein
MMRSTVYAHITARPAPSRSWYLRTFYVAVFRMDGGRGPFRDARGIFDLAARAMSRKRRRTANGSRR